MKTERNDLKRVVRLIAENYQEAKGLIDTDSIDLREKFDIPFNYGLIVDTNDFIDQGNTSLDS